MKFRLASFCIALTSGCGVGGSVQGTVSSMPARDADSHYVPAKPLGGAQIRLDCADGAPLTMTSDASGRFSADLSAALSTSCRLRVKKPGYYERTFSVAEACARDMGAQCKYLSLLARLLPEVAK